MTGRQFTRVGVPGVFGDSSTTGLPLNETTVADQLKKAGYATAIMGKVGQLPFLAIPTDSCLIGDVFPLCWHVVQWHLGQRPMFLPGARGESRASISPSYLCFTTVPAVNKTCRVRHIHGHPILG